MGTLTVSQQIAQLGKAVDALETVLVTYFADESMEGLLWTLNGQLRALMAFVPGRPDHPTYNPLLIRLARRQKVALRIYSYPPEPAEVTMPAGAIALGPVAAGASWSIQPFENWIAWDVEDWLQTPFYYDPATARKISRLAMMFSVGNKRGGHFDETLPPSIENLMNQQFARNGGPWEAGDAMFTKDMTLATVYLGRRLLRLLELRQAAAPVDGDAELLRIEDHYTRMLGMMPPAPRFSASIRVIQQPAGDKTP